MSTCTDHRMLNMLHHSIFYQLAQARPHNVLHFLVRNWNDAMRLLRSEKDAGVSECPSCYPLFVCKLAKLGQKL